MNSLVPFPKPQIRLLAHQERACTFFIQSPQKRIAKSILGYARAAAGGQPYSSAINLVYWDDDYKPTHEELMDPRARTDYFIQGIVETIFVEKHFRRNTPLHQMIGLSAVHY